MSCGSSQVSAGLFGTGLCIAGEGGRDSCSEDSVSSSEEELLSLVEVSGAARVFSAIWREINYLTTDTGLWYGRWTVV